MISMVQKRVNKILWHGDELENGAAKKPAVAEAADGLDGLNRGELYICDADEDPAIMIRTASGEVVRIGGADLDILREYFLSKNKEDSTEFLITFLKGIVFGKDGFASGMAGFGGKLGENGYGEMRGLTLWEWLQVPELRYNRVEVVIGDKCLTVAGRTVVCVTRLRVQREFIGNSRGHHADRQRILVHFLILRNVPRTDAIEEAVPADKGVLSVEALVARLIDNVARLAVMCVPRRTVFLECCIRFNEVFAVHTILHLRIARRTVKVALADRLICVTDVLVDGCGRGVKRP